EVSIGVVPVPSDVLLRYRKHAASTTGRVVDRPNDIRRVDVLILCIEKMRHETYDLTRGEVVTGLLVGLFVELADELFEDIAHLHIVDAFGVQIDAGELSDNQE